MLSWLRGRDERGLGVAKVFVLLVAALLALGSAPVLVPMLAWLVDRLF